MIHMGVARKWHFSTSGDAANLGGVSGDLFEHRGSGIPLLGITSLFMHKLTGLCDYNLFICLSCHSLISLHLFSILLFGMMYIFIV